MSIHPSSVPGKDIRSKSTQPPQYYGSTYNHTGTGIGDYAEIRCFAVHTVLPVPRVRSLVRPQNEGEYSHPKGARGDVCCRHFEVRTPGEKKTPIVALRCWLRRFIVLSSHWILTLSSHPVPVPGSCLPGRYPREIGNSP